MKLCTSVLKTACLTVGIIVLLGSVAPVRCDDLRSIVVLREDDIRATWRTPFPELGGVSAFTYCMNNQIPITWAAITYVADGSGSAGLTWAELKQYLSAAGGEVASHSINHMVMPTTADYINEVTGSKTAIEAGMGSGYVCKTFLQPGGWTGDAYMDTIAKLNGPIGQAIQTTYQYSMAYLGSMWRTGSTYYRYGLSNYFNIDYSSSLSVDVVNKTLDIVADCPGTVLVVSSHGVQATGGTVGYDVPANILKAFVEKVVALRASNKIRLMSYSDAMDQVFPQNMNQVPDIRVCDPPSDGSNAGPWRVIHGAQMSSNGGMDGGKCLELAVDNAQAICGWLRVAPGRYEISWYQRVIDGFQANSAVRMGIDNYLGSVADPPQNLISYAWFFNQQPNVWEQKNALFLIRDMQIPLILRFLSNPYNQASSGCRIDNVSLVLKPVDPSVSPSNVQVAASPTGGTVTWTTPNDPTITAIEIRYGTSTHPIDGTSNQLGMQPNTLLFNVLPNHGQTQTVPFTMNWAGKTAVYFSVFAKRGSAYSDPGIDYVMVPTGGPTVSITHVAPVIDGQTTVNWSVQSNSVPVSQSQYALGRAPGISDLLQWTPTTGTSATLSVPDIGGVYVSVKADNTFGYWSNTDSKQVTLPKSSVAQIKQGPDSTSSSVTVSGIVSAVFSTDCYVESWDRSSGIRVTGGSGFAEGQFVSVTGTLATANRERVLQITP